MATVRQVLASPITFIDTANGYGLAEERIGRALAAEGDLPSGTVLATKVDPAPGQDDFSGDRARASIAESQRRLGVDRFDLVYLHDPERNHLRRGHGPRADRLRALEQLRDEGVIGHLGVAGGPVDMLRRYVASGRFEVVITHNRWTLADRSAEPLLEEAGEAGVAVVNGAPFGGGIFVKGPDAHPCMRINRLRARSPGNPKHGGGVSEADVPLAAAALQFSLRETRIASTIVGFSSPERVEETLNLARREIPDDLWARLDGLAPAPEAWLR